MAELDPRLTPARADVAAARLKGVVRAERFVEGRAMVAVRGAVALRAAPDHGSRLETQVLYGEPFTVYDARDGWAWGQAGYDSYVGYVEAAALAAPGVAPTHRVTARFTHLYRTDDVKSAASLQLPMNAKVALSALGDRFAETAAGFVTLAHVAPLDSHEADYVAVAEELIGVPYLWGGRSPDGVDCSGLVQTALERAGITAPRDSDMQERALGVAVPLDRLQRGDLVFWSDHVGIMCDAMMFVHANSHHMMVAREPFTDALARTRQAGRAVTSVRRLVNSRA